MRKIVTYLFDTWWRPILFWAFTVVLFVISELVQNKTFGNISFVLVGIGLFGLLLSASLQLFQTNWLKGFFILSLFCGTIIVFFMYAVALFWIDQETPDQWADNLTIPKNIEIHNPSDVDFDNKRPDSIAAKKVTEITFQLYNSFQPGLYEYDFWIGKIDSGIIYLKAFEITQNYPLSVSRLPESSAVKVYNPSDSIMRFGTTKHFTIYEGDWGKPYAGRFEVWFKPSNGGQEKKLFTENYKIEGWMR